MEHGTGDCVSCVIPIQREMNKLQHGTFLREFVGEFGIVEPAVKLVLNTGSTKHEGCLECRQRPS